MLVDVGVMAAVVAADANKIPPARTPPPRSKP
jgi:hypothetical protein